MPLIELGYEYSITSGTNLGRYRTNRFKGPTGRGKIHRGSIADHVSETKRIDGNPEAAVEHKTKGVRSSTAATKIAGIAQDGIDNERP